VPPAPAEPSTGRGLRIAWIATGSAGAALLVTGIALGFVAQSANNDAKSHCSPNDSTLCDPTGVSLTDDARSAATVATVTYVLGGLAIAAGVTLFLVERRQRSTARLAHLRVVPAAAPSLAGLVLDGGW
jgi:hypothetical protein